jgi:crotonobetainyl-CoA:carnitine CoA-transferase CaiB-like acyl-CoA transferase
MHLGPVLAAASQEPASAANGPPVTAGVFRCAGDDAWCVIDIRDDADRARLAGLPGLDTGDMNRGALARWTAARRPADVMSAVQAAGVPAGAMVRWPDELTDPHLTARRSFRTLTHPLLSRPVPTGARVARFSGVADPPLAPAPVPGEHTRDIARTLLGLNDAEISQLAASGVLQLPEMLEHSTGPAWAGPGPVKVLTHPPAQGHVP